MTKSEAIARIYESYSEDEILNARDEPETRTNERSAATVLRLFGDETREADATRRRVKRAFHDAGHGSNPAEALANARRIFKRDEVN